MKDLDDVKSQTSVGTFQSNDVFLHLKLVQGCLSSVGCNIVLIISNNVHI